MENKKNPFAVAILTAAPSIFSAITGIIKDKKEKKADAKDTATTGEAVIESVKEITSGSFSSKRIMNVLGTGAIVIFALNDMTANGINKMNALVLAIGVVYSLGLTITTYLSEKK